jgi:hypothetical protein
MNGECTDAPEEGFPDFRGTIACAPASGWQCPSSHPHAYGGGAQCCIHEVDDISSESCPGDDDARVGCPSGLSERDEDFCADWEPEVALGLQRSCANAHPLHTRSNQRIGTPVSEARMRPNPCRSCSAAPSRSAAATSRPPWSRRPQTGAPCDGPRPPGAFERPWRFPRCINFVRHVWVGRAALDGRERRVLGRVSMTLTSSIGLIG